MKKNIDLGLLILRLSIGVLMLFHGIAKLNGGLGFIEGLMTEMGLPAFFAYAVLIGEIVVPLTIIVGYKTRLSAIILIINCLVAILLAHSEQVFTLSKHGGWAIELLGLYMFGALALVFTGAGKYSIDRK